MGVTSRPGDASLRRHGQEDRRPCALPRRPLRNARLAEEEEMPAPRQVSCPGKRILPKNLTGKEKLADLMDEAFLAYNAARLKEGCQLFTEKMLEPDVTIGMSLAGALTPAGLGCSGDRPADQGRLRGLDRRHRREPLPRHALRAELPGARRQLQVRRHRAAQQRHRPHLRHPARLHRLPDGHRRDPARASSSSRSSRRRWARPSCTTCSASTAPSGNARPASRTSPCWPPPTAPACPATPPRPATRPSA